VNATIEKDLKTRPRYTYRSSSVILLSMNEERTVQRSSELMSVGDTALLVVDVQEKLVPAIADHDLVVFNTRRLIDGAKILGIPVLGTEQYPRGLGPTVPELAERLGPMPDKLTFTCCGCTDVFEKWQDVGIHKILVTGIETHVCVQQTVLDLLGDGWRVYLAVDAVGSRFPLDRETALRRMDSSGAVLTTTEAALFEWCQVAGTPQFKEISRLVREERTSDG
jgi:nicotinamidase-related amidase